MEYKRNGYIQYLNFALSINETESKLSGLDIIESLVFLLYLFSPLFFLFLIRFKKKPIIFMFPNDLMKDFIGNLHWFCTGPASFKLNLK